MQGEMTIYRPGDAAPELRSLTAPPELEELQGLVGGYIEQVPLWKTMSGKPCVALCDEEGKLKEKPSNPAATAEWHRAAKRAVGIPPGDELVGTVVVLTGDTEFMNAL